jgi:hypothetical protein
METKYSLDYNNLCVLFHRGNDKVTETTLPNYQDYVNYALEIQKRHPSIVFLLQSDETEFLEYMTQSFPDNSFYFRDEIRHMKKCNDTVDKTMSENNHAFSQKYLAITVIMSKGKYLVVGSGNCSLWIMMYRGNADNVIQFRHGTWHNWAY